MKCPKCGYEIDSDLRDLVLDVLRGRVEKGPSLETLAAEIGCTFDALMRWQRWARGEKDGRKPNARSAAALKKWAKGA